MFVQSLKADTTKASLQHIPIQYSSDYDVYTLDTSKQKLKQQSKNLTGETKTLIYIYTYKKTKEIDKQNTTRSVRPTQVRLL